MTSPSFSLSSTIKHYPNFPYVKIKKAILGEAYQLSLVFIGATRAKRLNITTRNKNYVPNVLSFPLNQTTGEIYITPAIAKTEAKAAHLSFENYIGYLFIHGCLHLKGLDHGNLMDTLEQKYCQQFNIKTPEFVSIRQPKSK